jgi:hypothetical protein
VSAPVASFAGEGAYDGDDIYSAVINRHPDAAVILPPRSNRAEQGGWDRTDAARPASAAQYLKHAVAILRETEAVPDGCSPISPRSAGST